MEDKGYKGRDKGMNEIAILQQSRHVTSHHVRSIGGDWQFGTGSGDTASLGMTGKFAL